MIDYRVGVGFFFASHSYFSFKLDLRSWCYLLVKNQGIFAYMYVYVCLCMLCVRLYCNIWEGPLQFFVVFHFVAYLCSVE